MLPLYDEEKIKSFSPKITISLIILCSLIFFWSLVDPHLIYKFGFIPKRFFETKSFFPLFSSMFFHGGFFHLLSNMWYLWIFGNNLERKLGRFKFLIFYLLCGMGSALFYGFFRKDSTIPVIGASGAISGILGGYFILFPQNRIICLMPGIFFYHLIALPAVIFLGIWFIYQFLSLGSTINVAFLAHIGGFLIGLFLVKKFKR